MKKILINKNRVRNTKFLHSIFFYKVFTFLLDAIYVKNHWNSLDRNADVNFDGIVDKSDMQQIINNYKAKNQWVKNLFEPVLQYEGQSLETILKELGLK